MRITDNGINLTTPRWAADFISPKELMPAGGILDLTQFYAQDSVLVTTSASASANATSISVVALPEAIPSGAIIDFGTTKFARTTAAAAAGATSISVSALPTALGSGDTGRYAGSGKMKRAVPSGTVLGRTIAERDAGTGYGPFLDTDDEIFIVAFENPDIDMANEVDLVRPGFAVYENYLPGFSAFTSNQKAKLRSLFRMTLGVN